MLFVSLLFQCSQQFGEKVDLISEEVEKKMVRKEGIDRQLDRDTYMIGKRIDTSLEVSWATDASGTVSIES